MALRWVHFKMGPLFAFLADSSRALQACGQWTAFAVRGAAERPLARSACRARVHSASAPLDNCPQIETHLAALRKREEATVMAAS